MKSCMRICFGRLIWGIFACRPHFVRTTTPRKCLKSSSKTRTQVTITCCQLRDEKKLKYRGTKVTDKCGSRAESFAFGPRATFICHFRPLGLSFFTFRPQWAACKTWYVTLKNSFRLLHRYVNNYNPFRVEVCNVVFNFFIKLISIKGKRKQN